MVALLCVAALCVAAFGGYLYGADNPLPVRAKTEPVDALAELEAGALYQWNLEDNKRLRRYVGLTSKGNYIFEDVDPAAMAHRDDMTGHRLLYLDPALLTGRLTLGQVKRVVEPAA